MYNLAVNSLYSILNKRDFLRPKQRVFINYNFMGVNLPR